MGWDGKGWAMGVAAVWACLTLSFSAYTAHRYTDPVAIGSTRVRRRSVSPAAPLSTTRAATIAVGVGVGIDVRCCCCCYLVVLQMIMPRPPAGR
ncbi:hypothetical protein LY78DRAFT_654138 [Colletotrichum sublineola]|nr:hypothetical protein LY78DRAFT_654138 [Colletotrichum sublineola]